MMMYVPFSGSQRDSPASSHSLSDTMTLFANTSSRQIRLRHHCSTSTTTARKCYSYYSNSTTTTAAITSSSSVPPSPCCHRRCSRSYYLQMYPSSPPIHRNFSRYYYHYPPSLPSNRLTKHATPGHYSTSSSSDSITKSSSQQQQQDHFLFVKHTDMRIKQLATSPPPTNSPTTTITPQSEMIHSLKEGIKNGTLGGRGLTYGLKFLNEHAQYREAWNIATEAFSHLSHQQLLQYMPAISVSLLMTAKRLGSAETHEVLQTLINPQGHNRYMWLTALNSIRESKDSRVPLLFLKAYDSQKQDIFLDEAGLAVLIQYFSTFADMERSIEAFETRCLDPEHPLHIKQKSPQLLAAFFHHLTVMGRRKRNRDLAKHRILHYFEELCMKPNQPNHVNPNHEVLAKVLYSCSSSFDLEATRDFFDQYALPFLRENDVDPDEAATLILPLVIPWIKSHNYKSVIWLYERHFSNNQLTCEWNTTLINMLMQSYHETGKPQKVVQLFDKFFASGKRRPTSKTFNLYLLAKCAQDTSFQMTDGIKTFEQFARSLPTTATPPADYNQQLQEKKVQNRTSSMSRGFQMEGDHLDTSGLDKISPGMIKAVVTSLLERGNVDAAIQFFETYCQDPNHEHFCMPPYRSIREIAEAILVQEKDPEKALSFVEETLVDSRFTPPLRLMRCLNRIEAEYENVDADRIQGQRERFFGLGARETHIWRSSDKEKHVVGGGGVGDIGDEHHIDDDDDDDEDADERVHASSQQDPDIEEYIDNHDESLEDGSEF